MKRVWIGFVLSSLIVAGCTASAPTRLDLDYGTSSKLVKVNQALDPQAEQNLRPVDSMDGQAALRALDKYRKDFEKPPAPPVYTLDVQKAGQ
jgi:hypothetical protein